MRTKGSFRTTQIYGWDSIQSIFFGKGGASAADCSTPLIGGGGGGRGVPGSNGNASETKAKESFYNGVLFDIEAKRTPSTVSKLF